MNIGINGYYLSTPYSGIGQYTINLLNALSKVDSNNSYYVFSPKQVEWNFPQKFKLIIVKPMPIFTNSFLNRFIWEEFQLGWAVKNCKVEVFHALYQSLPRGIDKIGNVVTIHDAIPWRFPAERRKISYRIYSDIRKELVMKRAKKVTTISETSKIDFAPIYKIKPETIEVTYESVEPIFSKSPTESEIKDFKKRHKIDNEFILYIGGLKRHKNLRMLIKSFDILVKEHGFSGNLYILGAIRNTMPISPHIYYKVADLETYARLKNIRDRVKFIGFVSKEDMSIFMHLAKCFVSISLYEGFGLPALEAMTSGTPSVISNLGAYPEIANGASLFVYPYGPHRIAEALNKVVTDKRLRDNLIKKGLERAKFFDRIKIAKRILEIYKELYDDYKIKFQP